VILSTRRWPLICTAVIVSLPLAACGAPEPTIAEKNAALLKKAEAASAKQAAFEDEVMLAFRNKVGLYTESGIENSFKAPSGNCFVDSVFGAEGPRDTIDYTNLYDPKGRGGVVIGKFQGTRESDCTAITLKTLGWQEAPPSGG
jgi:hypothetical protein